MKRRLRTLAAVLVLALCVSMLAGCSSTVKTGKYSTTVVATLGDENIYLDEAMLYLRPEQYEYEWMYTYFYGTADIWDLEVSTGVTMGDSLRNETMSMLRQLYILMSHADEMGVVLTDADLAKIEEAADDVMENTDAALLASIGMDRDRMVEALTHNAIANLVWQAVADTADLDIDDEEVRNVGVTYVEVTDEDLAAALESDEEETETATIPTAEEAASDIYALVSAGSNLSETAEAYGLTAITTAYFIGDEFEEGSLGARALAMAEGDVDLFETEDGWYVMRLDSEMDEDATEEQRENLISERQDEAFAATYAVWQEEAPEFNVVSRVWKNISFDPVYGQTEETEEETTAEETEALEDAEEDDTSEETEETAAE